MKWRVSSDNFAVNWNSIQKKTVYDWKKNLGHTGNWTQGLSQIWIVGTITQSENHTTRPHARFLQALNIVTIMYNIN